MLDDYLIADEPYYRPLGNETALFEAAYANRLPVMLKGPTGCGKTRFVEHMAWRLKCPIVTVSCHEDMTASDLVGRFLLDANGTLWHDGPLTLAVRHGAICYLDEIVEARQDTTVIIHSLTDDRRILPLEKKNELVKAHEDFQLVISYNPGYQHVLKDFKPSTRQRFVALEFEIPPPQVEAQIVAHESGIDLGTARGLVTLAQRIRSLKDRGLTEVPSTRLLVATATLIASGIAPRQACRVGLILPLSDEPEVVGSMSDLVDAVMA
jgi:nitric oxide reductase NorQ protein